MKSGREPVAQNDGAAVVEEAERLTPEEAIAPTRDSDQKSKKDKKEKGAGGSSKKSGGATTMRSRIQKGGVAKTTTTLNLAVAFKEWGTVFSRSTSTPRATSR